MKSWEIHFDDNVWADGDLTVAEALDAAILAGAGWESLNPWSHPAHLVALVAVLLSSRTGEGVAEALDRIKALPLTELMAALVAVA